MAAPDNPPIISTGTTLTPARPELILVPLKHAVSAPPTGPNLHLAKIVFFLGMI